MQTMTGQNVPRTDTSDPANYPYGRAKNESFEGAGDGTAAAVETGIGDGYQINAEILRINGVIPNEEPERKGHCQVLDSLWDIVFPFGEIREFGTSEPPKVGTWMLAQGQAISRTTYPKAFAAFGTTFGSGNGTTTFNLPDRCGRVGIGSSIVFPLGEDGGAEEVTVPDHTHEVSTYKAVLGGAEDALNGVGQATYAYQMSVMQPYLSLNYYVRVK